MRNIYKNILKTLIVLLCVPSVFAIPIQVPDGGTGQKYLTPGTFLVGNGINGIATTTSLTGKSGTFGTLAATSSATLASTTLTGNTIIGTINGILQAVNGLLSATTSISILGLIVNGNATVNGTLSVTSTTTLASSTSPYFNGIYYIDGSRYTKDGFGIQNAVYDAEKAGGGRIVMGCGVFPMSRRIKMSTSSNITLEGSGRDCTIIRATSSIATSNSNQEGYQGMIWLDGGTATVTNVTMRDFTIDANNMTTTTPMTIGGGIGYNAGLKNVLLENLRFINATNTGAAITYADIQILPGQYTNIYNDPHGIIDGLTIDNVDINGSPYYGIYVLGHDLTNFTVRNSYIHNIRERAINFSQATDDPCTDCGGGDFESWTNWQFLNNRFENNALEDLGHSVGNIMMGVGGIRNVLIQGNYFGGVSTTTHYDNMHINLYNSLGVKIVDNYFGQNTEGISLGKSQSANYYKINPIQYAEISGNTFDHVTTTFDNDAAIGVNFHDNYIINPWQNAFGAYSRHYPLNFHDNLIVNPHSNQSNIPVGSCNFTAICVPGNEGLTFTNNTIIDNQLLKNPTVAPTLATTTGGSLGARTYFVQYSWINEHGEETLPSLMASKAIGANELITITFPSAISSTEKAGNGIPDGAVAHKIYIGTSSTTLQAQAYVLQHTQDFTWQEPTTGLVASSSIPAVTNNTKAYMGYGIIEINGSGDATLPNIYRGNLITGATVTAIKLNASSTSFTFENIFNLNSNTGSDDISYQFLPNLGSSTQPLFSQGGTSTNALVYFKNNLLNYITLLVDGIFQVTGTSTLATTSVTSFSASSTSIDTTLIVNGTSTFATSTQASSTIRTLFTTSTTTFGGGLIQLGGSPYAGQAMCYATGGVFGHCTGAVGGGGACTCVAN